MTRRQRFEALLSGRCADRVPRLLWRHNPLDDSRLDTFVAATLRFHREHDLDLLKLDQRSMVAIRDYGVQVEFRGDYLGRPFYLNQVIQSPADWRKLRPIDPDTGWLRFTGEYIRQVVSQMDKDTPVIVPVFSPSTQAKNLAGSERFVEHWRDHPNDVRAGLATLAESSVRFLQSLSDVPIDGVFFPIQECGLPDLSPGYREMCEEFDFAILTARSYWLNLLHLHGRILDLDNYARYPVSILHWDERASGISLTEGRERFSGIVSGGVAWPDEGWVDVAAVRDAAREAVERIGAPRLLLSAGCVLPYQTRAEHVNAFCSR